jgi:hypothetical protein
MIANNDEKSPVVVYQLARVQHKSLYFRRKLLVASLVVLGLTCLVGVESQVAQISSGTGVSVNGECLGKHAYSSYTRQGHIEPVETTIEAVSSATVEQQGTLTKL